MNIDKTALGYEIRTPELMIFFGGRDSQMSQLKVAYPEFSFTRVKQIHSDAVIESPGSSSDLQVVADAHFTQEKGLALCVVTADCVPAFIYHPQTQWIAGIHAGWRGVANKIIPKTLTALSNQGVKPEECSVVIGPHIQRKSFEVGLDVKSQILGSLGTMTTAEQNSFLEILSPEKVLLDLNQVVKTQLNQSGVPAESIFDLHLDTFADSFFHSFRRDKEKSGRQLSFICRL